MSGIHVKLRGIYYRNCFAYYKQIFWMHMTLAKIFSGTKYFVPGFSMHVFSIFCSWNTYVCWIWGDLSAIFKRSDDKTPHVIFKKSPGLIHVQFSSDLHFYYSDKAIVNSPTSLYPCLIVHAARSLFNLKHFDMKLWRGLAMILSGCLLLVEWQSTLIILSSIPYNPFHFIRCNIEVN